MPDPTPALRPSLTFTPHSRILTETGYADFVLSLMSSRGDPLANHDVHLSLSPILMGGLKLKPPVIKRGTGAWPLLRTDDAGKIGVQFAIDALQSTSGWPIQTARLDGAATVESVSVSGSAGLTVMPPAPVLAGLDAPTHSARSPRNIVICCDGTNNEFGRENTNVVRLVQALEHRTDRQHIYYDPGVGTLPEPGWMTAFTKWLSKVYGLAFGAGLDSKVLEAYAYLTQTWEPGDRVYLFGFSRGAYTVRVLAGLLHALGLMGRGSQNMLPYLMRLFESVRGKNPGDVKSYWTLCDEFRRTFARSVPGDDYDRRFRVHFLGVWDTVSSYGWVWNPKSFPFTQHNDSIQVIRHAVSVDERRAFFRQNLMQADPATQDLKQYWFPGVHADVGGGYPEAEGGLWRLPFLWIVDEAWKAGLLLDEYRLHQVLQKTLPPACPWAEPKHEQLTGWWWLAEYFPKAKGHFPWFRLNRGRSRDIKEGEMLDVATLLRIRSNADYNPPNFSAAFLAKIRALPDVSGPMPFEK